MDKLLKVLRAIWSVFGFLLIAAFSFGGERNDWNEVKQKVLIDNATIAKTGLPALK